MIEEIYFYSCTTALTAQDLPYQTNLGNISADDGQTNDVIQHSSNGGIIATLIAIPSWLQSDDFIQ